MAAIQVVGRLVLLLDVHITSFGAFEAFAFQKFELDLFGVQSLQGYAVFIPGM